MKRLSLLVSALFLSGVVHALPLDLGNAGGSSASTATIAGYSGWQDNGNSVSLITGTDQVCIGATCPSDVQLWVSTTMAGANARWQFNNESATGFGFLQLMNDNSSLDGSGLLRNGSSQTGYAGANSLNLFTGGAAALGLATANVLRLGVGSGGAIVVGDPPNMTTSFGFEISSRTVAITGTGGTFTVGAGTTPSLTTQVGQIGLNTNVIATDTSLHLASNSASTVLRLTNDTSGITSSDGLQLFLGATDSGLWNHESRSITLTTAGLRRVTVGSNGNVGVGNTAAINKLHVSTGGVRVDGTTAYTTYNMNTTSPTAVTADAHIWAINKAGTAEMQVMDGAGNMTVISPHNQQGEWMFYSENVHTGKKVYINMERFIRKMEEVTGEQFIFDEVQP